MIKVNVTWMTKRDFPQVMKILDDTSWPMDPGEWLERVHRDRQYIAMVAKAEDRVVGLMVYEFINPDILVHTMLVGPAIRRQRVGQQMARTLIGKLDAIRTRRIILCVRETNLAAQLFLRGQGFVATNVDHEHFLDTGEDAYEMVYQYGQTVGPRCIIAPFLREAS